MFDNSLYFAELAKKTDHVQGIQLRDSEYVLATIHRDNNTDQAERLNAIFCAFNRISKEFNTKIILPLHPRTAKLLESKLSKNIFEETQQNSLIKLIEPASFIEITALEMHASMLITDSGGLQKEAFFFQKPCIILRPETEWVELVKNGNAILADADAERIYSAFLQFKNMAGTLTYPTFYGDGKAAEKICQEISNKIRIRTNLP